MDAAAANAFPPGFLWGAASAGHQTEGNNTNSDCWYLEHSSPEMFRGPSGDVVDHYHRYADDIALMADLGWNAFRFSLEWARIEPEEGHISLAELDHYRRVAATCHEHGLSTVVTFNHWTVPRWFAADGSWPGPKALDRWCRFVEAAAGHLGDEIDWACTLNEPNVYAVAIGGGEAVGPPPAPPAVDPSAPQPFHGLFLWPGDQLTISTEAHRRAKEIIKAGPGSAPVGWTLALEDCQALDGGDDTLARSRNVMQDAWLDVSADDDFVGVQNYTRRLFGPDGTVEPAAGTPVNDLGWELYPPSLANVCRHATARTGVPALVTEHGVATGDDTIRLAHTKACLVELEAAVADGVDVRGYLGWTAFDEFEWFMGYDVTFGLIAVDRTTFERTPKETARWLGRCAAANALVE